MKEIRNYPVQPSEYSREEAPYVYTELGEFISLTRPRLEPRTVGTIACFAGKPLQRGVTADAWVKAGYVVER